MVGDITCLPTAEGRLCPACWLDLATREVIGYAMAGHRRAEPVVDALVACGRGGPEPGCVVRSDRGSEYAPAQFRDGIRELGLRAELRTHRIVFRQRRGGQFLVPAQRRDRNPDLARPGHRPPRGLQLHRDLLQPPPPAQAQDPRLPHPGRDQAAASTRPHGTTNECPGSRGNFTGHVAPDSALTAPGAYAREQRAVVLPRTVLDLRASPGHSGPLRPQRCLPATNQRVQASRSTPRQGVPWQSCSVPPRRHGAACVRPGSTAKRSLTDGSRRCHGAFRLAAVFRPADRTLAVRMSRVHSAEHDRPSNDRRARTACRSP
ncbi:DDE-type integrase/transposase/recombinase [Streptomyces iconiensis]|uniref:DDE-type integrase/transposase/recombinase n=1 Tax=Streptomyces iconiensis TaxID=1384038 RepID=UPI003D2F63A8